MPRASFRHWPSFRSLPWSPIVHRWLIGDWAALTCFFFGGKNRQFFGAKLFGACQKTFFFWWPEEKILMLFPLHAKNTWNPMLDRFFHVRVFRLIQDARSWINHYSPKQDDPWAVRPIGLGAQFLNGSDLVDVVYIIGGFTYGCFHKWWYPRNTPKWSFLVGKPMFVGGTTILGNHHI